MPPLRPASRASSLVHSWAVPFWCAALPPLLAISRCLARSIEANPRSSFATSTLPDSHARPQHSAFVLAAPHACRFRRQRRTAHGALGCNGCATARGEGVLTVSGTLTYERGSPS